MADVVRLNLKISKRLDDDLEQIAEDLVVTKTEVFRIAIALLKFAHDEKKKGRHLGIVSDPDKLDTVFVGPY